MIAAVALMAGTLAPALAVMRDAMILSRECATRALLANYAVDVIERHASLTMQTWSNGSFNGSFVDDGRPTVRYAATLSDAPADGGLTDRLMHIQVTVFDDKDANGELGADELRVNFRTKVAKFSSYQNAPN